ncbi:DUF3303 family protein [Profundibacterium mesophilum]|uniref:Uncharacterized protein n=1 Tax=Profundibacterium mesophilum KAUST100406-0324 TaxID=1037889 RepID=A0A921NSX8_9RHOB|nr:hypothetical protein [Profundibacterium mesophilum]KAF0677357.1 hypothetical protein PMES_00268 [Profundibacterium mesophilum KAUST100406-0324]
MQLLIQNTTNDPEAWKNVFETDREAQAAAGLSLLQMWHAEGDPNAIWLLFEVSDRDRAQAWVDSPQSALHATRAGIIDSAVHFLQIA